MKKISILLKLCYKFSKKYMAGYFTEIAKPIFFGILGLLLLFACALNSNFIICGILSIPFLCWAFWKGYVITYGLIPCADNFIKNAPDAFDNYAKEAKFKEKEFAKYVCFCALLTIICYIPSVIYIQNKVPFSFDALSNISYIKMVSNTFMVNTIILAPFLNYFLCAYYYKKDNENYFKLFLNCYKYLDVIGILIAIIATAFSIQGGLIYIILALFLNPFIYSINTFWYSSRLKN